MSNGFLDRIYAARGQTETRQIYDDWAATYDAEVAGNGYATPARCAAALAAHTADLSAPVLDFGCGTGLSGCALRDAGFTTIDGMDLSAEMLAEARKKDVYRTLTRIEADHVLTEGAYASIAAIGVIGAGAAPISLLDRLLRALGRGGRLVFSFNDHTLQDPVHEARINEWTDCGAAYLLMRERGDHLPALNMSSNVYILEKA